MTFKSQMADDLAAVLNSSEFDEPAEYYPGLEGSTHFTVRIVRGDITTGASSFDQGTEHTRTCEAVLIRSVVRAGILVLESTARDPRRGDRITFTDDSESAGIWIVSAVGAVDVGGGVTVSLEHVSYGNPGGSDANEVR
jgi:hypothetical protein